MTHSAEERTLADAQLRKREAEHLMQQETALAKANLLKSDARIHDWRAVRFAETLMRYWDERSAQAETALEQRKNGKRRHD
ncbi:MAG: hypothetical protein ACXV3U_08670 [Halobacteriota archaeon]